MRVLFTLILSLTSYFIAAQELITPSANEQSNESISISWSLGEVVVETLANQDYALTQGFQQPWVTITRLNENFAPNWEMKLYPNPTSKYLYLEIKDDKPIQSMHLFLININGKVLLDKMINQSLSEIDLSIYPSGIYFIKISEKENKNTETYKILKN